MDNNQGYGLSDQDVKQIAATTYGENRGQSPDAVLQTASSVFNRIGNNEWSNMSVPQIVQNGYYAVSHPQNNTGYTDAINNQFPDDDSANSYKKIYSTVAALNRGTIQPTPTQFYFKQSEINSLIKNKGFDFSKVNEGSPFDATVGGQKTKFRTFYYK